MTFWKFHIYLSILIYLNGILKYLHKYKKKYLFKNISVDEGHSLKFFFKENQ